MDCISVNASCFAASDAIVRTSLALSDLTREVRESQPELNALEAELRSLDCVFDLLKVNLGSLSAPLAKQTPVVLHTCLTVIEELHGCLLIINRPGLPLAEKRSRWLASRRQVGSLRWTLGIYKLVLGLTADLAAVSQAQERDSPMVKVPGRPTKRGGPTEDVSEREVVVARIIELSSGLHKSLQQNVALAKLKHYLDSLHAEAVATTYDHPEAQALGHPRDGRSSLNETPDSAIDMTYDEACSPRGKHIGPSPPVSVALSPLKEAADEFDGELNEMPIQTPPVPPRSASRLSPTSTRPSWSDRYSSSTDRTYDSNYSMSSRPPTVSPTTRGQRHPFQEGYFIPVTQLATEARDSYTASDSSSEYQRGSGFGPVLSSVWESSHEDLSSPMRPTSGSQSGNRNHENKDDGRAFQLERSSSRFSKALRTLGLRRASSEVENGHPKTESEVFGVTIAQSMKVAKGVAGVRHAGSGTSSHTTRAYPLCVLRCTYHIRDCGLETPHLFGIQGDQQRVAQLKEIFSSPDTSYGKELDWSHFSVHDAGDLILLFLSELPKPLVSGSIGKRWIALSRQATVRGSLAIRLDQGIDFWEEALLGIHGRDRDLLKLLLNLWADVTEAAELNDMTPERLASRVINALMHLTATQRNQTDFVLGLAFIIRRRSEDNIAAKGVRPGPGSNGFV